MKRIFTLLICLLSLTFTQADTVKKSLRRAAADAPVLTSSSCWSGQESYDLVNGDRLELYCFLRNYTQYGGPWDWGWACYDTTGKTVWVAQTTDGYQLGYGYGWDDSGDEIFYRGWEEMPNRFEAKDMVDGTYTIKPVSKLTGTSEWHNNLGTDACYLTAEKSGNTLTVRTTKVAASLTMTPSITNATNEIVKDDYVKIAINVSNTGTTAYNDYVLAVMYKDRNDGTGYGDYASEAAAMTSITPGESTTVEMSIDKLEDGANYFIAVYYKKDGEWERGSQATPYFTVKMSQANLSINPTIKYMSNGFIGTQTVTINLHITNNASETYDNQVAVVTYKDRNDGTGYGDYAGEAISNAKLEPGQSIDLELTIENMENGASYFVSPLYKSKGEWVRGSNETPYYTVKFSPASLQITPSVVNAKDELVEADKALFSFQISNTGATAYHDVVIAKVYKLRNDNSGYGTLVADLKQMVSVAPGEDINATLTFDNVEDGASYFFWCYYISNGKEVEGADYTPFFTFKYSTAISVASINPENKPTTVYSLDGRKVKIESGNVKQAIRQLPKGVYIVNGKKIRN